MSNSTSESKTYVVLDNDNCVGSWDDLSLLYSLLKYYSAVLEAENFAKLIDELVCIRPHMRKFYDTLLKLKEDGKIDGIFMFTACSNKTGWVDFLKTIIETWYGKKIYDVVVHLETIKEYHIENKTSWCNDIGIIKDMQLFVNKHSCDPSGKFIVFDDIPNIYNHSKLFIVPKYTVAVNLPELLRIYMPDIYSKCTEYYVMLNESWRKYIANPLNFTNAEKDDIFFHLCDELSNEIMK